ncbi:MULTISPECIES: hypothetical protein [Pseudomonas]|jgi:transketolase|uniref:Uncharacterized protein n=1 Tax=Pseudomonas putida (strain ATCC 47054 / DSM 6125 / CFBP 8728 / NCIMB 11950 / KT2440) TaxID=160488 RepID=Q88G18_PSEPK|nr:MULTISPECIES: hypothetical protein [Pseudomonas]AAN69502.1 conserved protein of unknown function [Pseudomonas putida KT2440]KMU94682.1 hypothetical protein AC138_17830 [Pseudomonas putida]KMY31144.1 hypothetical protein AA993_19960 [Pseudomonas putida]MDD2082004.1 hypothetical protein [Pseudomonas putida]PXZ46785.1 hypothetical protein DM483_22800 [Pseudomonas sp. SMT-1]
MTEQKTGVAKHSADYRARQKAQAKKLGIEKVFFNMPEGIKAAMAAEIERHGYEQVQELWQDLALSWIAQDPEERTRRLKRPDAPAFYISPKLARQFNDATLAELKRYPGDEIVPPL